MIMIIIITTTIITIIICLPNFIVLQRPLRYFDLTRPAAAAESLRSSSSKKLWLVVKLGWSGPVTHEVIDELIGWVGLGWERWDETISYSNSMIWSRTGHDKWQVQHVLATSMAFWINLMSSDAVQHLSTMARQSFFGASVFALLWKT